MVNLFNEMLSDHNRRRYEAWMTFISGPAWHAGIDQETFNVIYDLGFCNGQRLGYDEGFNEANMIIALWRERFRSLEDDFRKTLDEHQRTIEGLYDGVGV